MNTQSNATPLEWRELVASYRTPSIARSLWQIANTFLPFCLLWYGMYRSLAHGYWLTLLLAPIEAGLLVRIFILFHDCGHASFFSSQRANEVLGWICGVLSWSPYEDWRHSHALHHASSSDLGRRVEGEMLPLTIAKVAHASGGVLTLTVSEYKQLGRWEQLLYRVYRHPLLLFGVLPMFVFIVFQRFSAPGASRRARRSVWGTNLALLVICLGLGSAIGFRQFVMIEFPIMLIATTVGMWLFYVQHQFEETFWAEQPNWSYVEAALHGSSYYRLPRLLQWFTGNIGFHHVHHLSPRIPNYYLQECHESSGLFQDVPVITLWGSLKSLSLRLWDEEQHKLVSFKQALSASPGL